jgi:hypothetical protein
VNTGPRVQWAPGIPHALNEGESFINGSGAWRGEVVNVCLPSLRANGARVRATRWLAMTVSKLSWLFENGIGN